MKNFMSLAIGMVVATFAGVAVSGEVVDRFEIPQTGEPARIDNPPCANETPKNAEEILQGITGAVDYLIGYPVTTAILKAQSPGNVNWAKVRLGLHNGPSFCKMSCVAYPANVKVTKEVCFSETGGDGRGCFTQPGSGIDYTKTVDWTTAKRGNTEVFCAVGKNWSHNRNRWFEVRAKW